MLSFTTQLQKFIENILFTRCTSSKLKFSLQLYKIHFKLELFIIKSLQREIV